MLYSVLTAIVAGSIGVLSNLFQKLIVAVTGSQSSLATVFAALIVGMAINPVHKGLQALVDKALKDSADPAKRLAELQEQVRQRLDSLHAKIALRRLLHESITVFGAQGGAIYWGDGNDPHLAYSQGEWSGEAVMKALLQIEKGVSGYLALGPRRNQRHYSSKEDQILQEMAHVVTLAIEQDE